MTLDRANYYGPANRTAQDFGGSGSMPKPDAVVWHSTEGTGWPGYNGGSMAPHLTVMPDFTAKRLIWRQHFPFSQYGKALRNTAGGVETNRSGVIQVEIVGTCDPAAHRRWNAKHLFMPELPDWAIEDLAKFAWWCKDHHGVPFTAPTFRAYPASYGDTSTRLTHREWNAFAGHCGHQHVPENSHGDPGDMPIKKILAAAARLEEEADMPSAKDVAKEVVDQLRPAIRQELLDLLNEPLIENRRQPWEDPAVKPGKFSVLQILGNIEKDTDHPPATPATPN